MISDLVYKLVNIITDIRRSAISDSQNLVSFLSLFDKNYSIARLLRVVRWLLSSDYSETPNLPPADSGLKKSRTSTVSEFCEKLHIT